MSVDAGGTPARHLKRPVPGGGYPSSIGVNIACESVNGFLDVEATEHKRTPRKANTFPDTKILLDRPRNHVHKATLSDAVYGMPAGQYKPSSLGFTFIILSSAMRIYNSSPQKTFEIRDRLG